MVTLHLHHLLPVIALLASIPAAAQSTPQFVKIDGSSAAHELVLAPVRRKAVATRITATAIVEPDASAVAEITTQIPAKLIKLVAQLGQTVRPGEPLLIVSSVEVGQAKTEFLKARSLESISNLHLRREEDLYSKKITPMKDLLEARAEHDTALAQYKAARERLRLLIPAVQ